MTFSHYIELCRASRHELALDAKFFAYIGERPYINSGASSERILGPTSLVSAKYCFRASGTSDLCFMKYSRDILVASSHTINAYCFPPMECTGFFPEVSTKTLPCLLSDRDWVVFFTGALNPFAAEHPTHGSSLTPGLSLFLAASRIPSADGGGCGRWCGGSG